MTNEVAGGKVAAAVVSMGTAIIGWLPHVEEVMRIIASGLSILAAFFVVWPQVRRLCKKMFRKKK